MWLRLLFQGQQMPKMALVETKTHRNRVMQSMIMNRMKLRFSIMGRWMLSSAG
jgi:hypothetical protein